ncbi:MAG: hypothetical protein V2I36_14445 [Desulfopila sp.]|jgi:hypothetical protein|nr:hypothetical protein [Desulfopila sp.]
MSIHSTTGNYFRSAAHPGIRQKVARRRVLDLPGGVLLWKSVGKILLWGLPLILAGNLWCASVIDAKRMQHAALEQSLSVLQKSRDELVVQEERLTSPVRVEIAAAAKFSLFVPTPEQIQPM